MVHTAVRGTNAKQTCLAHAQLSRLLFHEVTHCTRLASLSHGFNDRLADVHEVLLIITRTTADEDSVTELRCRFSMAVYFTTGFGWLSQLSHKNSGH